MIPDVTKRKSLSILAIDPGPTSGISIFVKGEHLNSYAVEEEYLPDFFYNIEMSVRKSDYIIIESFRLYPHKAQSLTNDAMITPQIIGKLKQWFKDYKIIEQSASQVKQFFTDKRLKEMDCYVKNKHCRDAMRHALYALYFNKEVK